MPYRAPLGREFTTDLQLALTRRSPIGAGFANKPNDGRYFIKRVRLMDQGGAARCQRAPICSRR